MMIFYSIAFSKEDIKKIIHFVLYLLLLSGYKHLVFYGEYFTSWTDFTRDILFNFFILIFETCQQYCHLCARLTSSIYISTTKTHLVPALSFTFYNI